MKVIVNACFGSVRGYVHIHELTLIVQCSGEYRRERCGSLGGLLFGDQLPLRNCSFADDTKWGGRVAVKGV